MGTKAWTSGSSGYSLLNHSAPELVNALLDIYLGRSNISSPQAFGCGRGPRPRPAPASSNRAGSLTAIVLGAALGAGALFHFQPAEPLSDRTQTIPVPPTPLRQPATNFVCDGRIYCSQMHSCEEATYFLQKCPGVEMDGEGDGIPCEQQWCN